MKTELSADTAWLNVSGETSPPAPVAIKAPHCSLCLWPSARLYSYYDEAVCPLCWLSFNLDSPSAAQGAISWLPGMKTADVIQLQRLAIIAARGGTKNQQRNGQRVIKWLLRHKRETENYWKTSRPAEFATAMSRLHPTERMVLRKSLTGAHLIMPASTFDDLTLLLPADKTAEALLKTCYFPDL